MNKSEFAEAWEEVGEHVRKIVQPIFDLLELWIVDPFVKWWAGEEL